MKIFIPLLSLFVVLHCVPAVSAQTGADYYPLRKGDSWLYKTTPIGKSGISSRTDKVVVWGKLFVGDKEAIVKENEDQNGSRSYQWLQKDSEGNIVLASISTEPSRERRLVDFEPPMIIISHDAQNVGASWEIRQKTNLGELLSGTFLVESNKEKVIVPAGTFRDCLKVRQISYDENGKNGTRYIFFAKGIGIVLTEQTEPENKRYRDELVEYTVK
ncbi:MAG: hypothetical protein Q8O92_14870 [Candidatus Latescibacter sp.]|nr:hypothetical protein [Candidatus Latescibacter sp.]